MHDWERLATTMRNWRAREDLSQHEAAERLGVSLSIVSRMESGREPRWEYAPRTAATVAQHLPRRVGVIIAQELGLDVDGLVFADDEPDDAHERILELVEGMTAAQQAEVERFIRFVKSNGRLQD